jgi:hypothetical protein
VGAGDEVAGLVRTLQKAQPGCARLVLVSIKLPSQLGPIELRCRHMDGISSNQQSAAAALHLVGCVPELVAQRAHRRHRPSDLESIANGDAHVPKPRKSVDLVEERPSSFPERT